MAKKSNWVEFIGSVRFAIFLLIIITIISLVGIVVPQDLPEEQYIAQWGKFLTRILLPIGITHIFTTFWFYLLLGLLSLNIIVCAILKLWKKVDNALNFSFLSADKDLSQFRHSFSIKSKGNEALVRNAILGYLGKKTYAYSTQETPVGIQIAAHKGRIREIGSFLFHLSIIIIFIGGLIARLGGYSYLSELSNGSSAEVRERDFRVKSEWFRIEKNDDGSIKDFKTSLSLIRPDNSVIVNKIIEVNSPLSYQGIRFYQASYGEDANTIENALISISGPGIDSTEREFNNPIPFSTPIVLPKSGYTMFLKQFIPDFIIDMETRAASSRSDKPNNPALNILLFKDKDTLFNHWVFLKFPDMHSGNEKYKVTFLDYTPAFYTGIQVRRNPGVPFIWAGILCMTFGIFALFYISKRNLWIFIEKDENKELVVSVAGTSDRDPLKYKIEFNRIKAEFEQIGLEGNK